MKIEPEAIIAIITALVGGAVKIIQLLKKNRRLTHEKENTEAANRRLIRERTRPTN